MRISRKAEKITEGDMTPMIDMTFQLIAFFMVIISFKEVEQNQAIQLPKSELAKPSKDLKHTITLQITRPGSDPKDQETYQKTYVYYGGRKIVASPPDELKEKLELEKAFLEARDESMDDATIIIRADSRARAGEVQRIIILCQKVGFEKFALRALQEKEHL